MPAFKTNLKRLMLEKSVQVGYPLTQKEVAEATGLSIPAISRWYAGSVERIEASTVGPLLRYFDCSLSDLVEFDAQSAD